MGSIRPLALEAPVFYATFPPPRRPARDRGTPLPRRRVPLCCGWPPPTGEALPRFFCLSRQLGRRLRGHTADAVRRLSDRGDARGPPRAVLARAIRGARLSVARRARGRSRARPRPHFLAGLRRGPAGSASSSIAYISGGFASGSAGKRLEGVTRCRGDRLAPVGGRRLRERPVHVTPARSSPTARQAGELRAGAAAPRRPCCCSGSAAAVCGSWRRGPEYRQLDVVPTGPAAAAPARRPARPAPIRRRPPPTARHGAPCDTAGRRRPVRAGERGDRQPDHCATRWRRQREARSSTSVRSTASRSRAGCWSTTASGGARDEPPPPGSPRPSATCTSTPARTRWRKWGSRPGVPWTSTGRTSRRCSSGCA